MSKKIMLKFKLIFGGFLVNFLLCLGVGTIYSQESSEEYVCFPCGYDCDKLTHDASGNCPSCKLELVKKSDIKYNDLSPEEVAEIVSNSDDYIILDVRTVEEYSGEHSMDAQPGHLIRAINIPHRELYSRIDELDAYKDKEIIVYCSHSHRSRFSSQILTENGFTKIYNMAEGITSFKAKGLKHSETGESLIVK